MIEAHSEDIIPPELSDLWEESGGWLEIHERLACAFQNVYGLGAV